MKRKLALLLALLMVFSLFAACGKKEETKTDTGKSSGTTSGGAASGGAASGGSTSGGTPSATNPQIEGAVASEDMVCLENIWNMEVHPSDDATLEYAFHNNCTSLQYIGGVDNGALYPDLLFYETPLAYDAVQNKVIGWMVYDWQWTSDTVLRCKINKGITSIMGDPYTANDFYYTLDWQCHNPSITTFFGIIDFDNCKVIDDYTIDIAVKTPYPFLELEMTAGAWSQVVEASVEKIGGKEATMDDERAGTGPYFVTDWEPNQFIYAERREDYWGVMPYYKYINVTTVLDANARAFGIEAGDFDFSNEMSAMQVETAAQTKGMKTITGNSPAYCYGFVFNSDHEPLNNVEVRRAMAMAIDYEQVLKIVLRGYGDVSDAPLCPPANELYTPVEDQSKNYIRYDLEAAKQKMIDAGYPDGFTLKCVYRGNDTTGGSISEVLYNMFEKINVKLELEPYESAAYTTITRTPDPEYDVLFAIGANPSPKRFLQPVDPSCGFTGVSGYCGDAWYGDYDLQSLVNRCANTVDKTERLAAWKELNDLCREYVPKVILFGKWTAAVANDNIDGYVNCAYGNPYLWSAYRNEYLGK